MEKGCVDNGFIIDLAHSKKTSDVIYELSKILDMPEAKYKKICLKLGSMDLSEQELVSIKALIETMDSMIKFISTTSEATSSAAKSLGIEISEMDSTVLPALDITATEDKNKTVNQELENALDRIFGSDALVETKEEDKNYNANKATETKNDNEEAIEGDIQLVTFQEVDSLEELKKHDKETEKLPTLYIHRTLHSGQSISSDGNIVIIGDVNPGAEIIAKGDITVWGILGGIAHAGSDGTQYAKIRALKLNAIQLRIGNIIARRPDTVNTPYIHRTDSYIPEEAIVNKNHIMIYKLHES